MGTAAQLIIALVYIGDIKAYHLTVLGHYLTMAELIHAPAHRQAGDSPRAGPDRLVVPDGARVRPGRNWARILSTALFGLATLELIGTTASGKCSGRC